MLEHLIGPFRTSPLGLVPKAGSSKLRLVQDLSFPRNDPLLPSVNAHIDSDQFPTAWGTFNDTSTLILSLPPGCKAAAFDISAAYRITPVLPSQQHMLCISWRGKVYVDRAVCFGLQSSAGVFGAVADMLVDIYEASHFGPIRKWVDDFLVVQLPHQNWTESDFISLTAAVGVPWSASKTKPLASCQRYLGFDWDLTTKSVSFPAEKLKALRDLLSLWLTSRGSGNKFSSHDAAHLHGKLVHAATIFPIIRPFLRSTSHFATRFQSTRARLHAPSPVLSDLQWIFDILLQVPNQLALSQSTPVDLNWWGDASTSFGIGVIAGPFWAAFRWASPLMVGPSCEFDIGWAEAVAVEMGLRLVIETGQLSAAAMSNQFVVRSDNTGVVAVINKGRSRSSNTNTVLKRIYATLAIHGIHLSALYVSSADNCADPLSRGDVQGFLSRSVQAAVYHSPSIPSELTHLLHPWCSQQ